jgi:hypothetical protein
VACCSNSVFSAFASSGGKATLLALRYFRPFHWMGLCDAVAISAASAPSRLTIMATPGVVTMSRSITSIPLAASALTAASRTHGPLGRESRPKTTRKCVPLVGVRVCFSQTANAAANCVTTGGVSVPPTVPRSPETPSIKASMRRVIIGLAVPTAIAYDCGGHAIPARSQPVVSLYVSRVMRDNPRPNRSFNRRRAYPR